MITLNNAVRMAHALVEPHLAHGFCFIDATAGNGNDTLFMARLSAPAAKVLAFDVQVQALETARNRLAANGLADKVEFILDTHENVAAYLDKPVDAAMFNLGYLPGGDHARTTQGAATLAAVQALLPLMRPGGLLTIVAYPGHPTGREELELLRQYLTGLSQKLYAVYEWRPLNQINDPPVLLAVQRMGSEGIERITPL